MGAVKKKKVPASLKSKAKKVAKSVPIKAKKKDTKAETRKKVITSVRSTNLKNNKKKSTSANTTKKAIKKAVKESKSAGKKPAKSTPTKQKKSGKIKKEEVSSSDSEEDTKANIKSPRKATNISKASKVNNKKKNIKVESSSDEQLAVKSSNKKKPAAAAKGKTAKTTKVEESSSDSDDDENVKKTSKSPPKKSPKKVIKNDSDEDGGLRTSSKTGSKRPLKKATSTAAAAVKKPTTSPKKTIKKEDTDYSSDDEPSLPKSASNTKKGKAAKEEKTSPKKKPLKATAATKKKQQIKAKKAKVESSSSNSSSSDDDDDDKPRRKPTVKANKTKAKSKKIDTESDSEEEEEKTKKNTSKKVISSKRKKAASVVKKATAKDKVQAAKAKLKQMQKSGFLGAPPRRAASLTAAAMVHFMYDNEQHQPSKNVNNKKAATAAAVVAETPTTKKPEKSGKSENAETKKRKKLQESSSDGGEQTSDSSDNEENQKLSSSKKTSTPKSSVKKGQPTKKKKPANQPIYSKNPSHTSSDSSDSEEEQPILKKAKKSTKIQKKKSMKDEFKMDIKDMIVKKRLASLNASAIMSASYAQERTKDLNSTTTALVPYSASQAAAALKKAKKESLAEAKKQAEATNPSTEKHIIVEIEDERIKSQLIANAMKKAGKKGQAAATNTTTTKANKADVVIMKASDALKASVQKLPPKKRATSSLQKEVHEKKRPKILKVVESSSSSSSEEESEEEIEEITTEGARANGIVPSNNNSRNNPLALKTEMNKVDVIVDGRGVAGMYQVVHHRYETISTTTAVVPRSVADDHHLSQVQNDPGAGSGASRSSTTATGGRYTPLSALASLQPGGSNAAAASGPRFPQTAAVGPQASTTFQQHHFAPHQGFYQPAGPLIRSASPGGTVGAAAPPTATVQPTVVTSVASTANNNTRSNNIREGEFSPSQKDPGSPVKPTPQQAPPPAPTATAPPTFQPAGYQNPFVPPFYPPPGVAGPHPHAVPPHPFYQSPAGAPPPFAAQPYGFDYRGYHLYPPPHPPTAQYGSYYLAPALSYQPASTATATPSTATSVSTSQVALPTAPPPPHPPYFYGGYTYPYSAGRIVTPILALAPHQAAAYPYGPPVVATPPTAPGPPPNIQPNPPTAPGATVPTEATKNSQAGLQVVGKGSNSSNNQQNVVMPSVTTPLVGVAEANNSAAKITGPAKAKKTSGGGDKQALTSSANHVSVPPSLVSNLAPSKSSLRDYRKPSKQPKQSTSSSGPTQKATEFARALSGGEISVTAIVGPKLSPAPPKQQPPIVSMFPVPLSKPPILTPEVPIKKPVAPAATPPTSKSNGVHNLPVLHIPEYTPSIHRRPKKTHILPPMQQVSNSSSRGHPGMPNGLLQLSTSLQQKGPTKVTPKDQNARMALSKIGLVEPSPITVSMAKSAASAVTVNRATLLKPSPKSSKSSKNVLKMSPESSRSSSRNSSVSPRERPSSSMKNRASPPSSSTTASLKKQSWKKDNKVRPLIPWSKRNLGPPKNCNGWAWVGEGIEQKVYLNNEEPPVPRICYSSMKHVEGDVVSPRDCILLASGNRKKDLPFVAKVTALWENPDDGEMCMSLLWYYRPEHLDCGRRPCDTPDEIYASRHRDHTSVACIEDKCYVMTFNEYCRYSKFIKMVEDNVPAPLTSSYVPELVKGYERANQLPKCRVAPDRVFLCRRVYDSRLRRLFKNPA